MARKSDHSFKGDQPFCGDCHRLESFHRLVRNRRAYYSARVREPQPLVQDRIIGIDGEGVGRKPHRYVYLGATDENGRKWSVSIIDSMIESGRLTTEQCLDFILSLPARSLIIGFAFLYDLTKILQDLPDKALFLLFREKLRARKKDGKIIYRAIRWRGYRLNYMNRRFTVQKGKRRATVWDFFRFFQSSFVNALIDWQIAGKAKLERMREMKEKRAEFDKLPFKQIKEYCDEETSFLSTLGRRLVDSHKQAGIQLRSYFGAGSTASALLKSWGIGAKRGVIPEAMREPVARSFFGGRFENSVVGPVTQRVFEYDISSAYPYQATLLPCLLHGHWQHVTRGIDNAIGRSRLILIRWRSDAYGESWGALPVRSTNVTLLDGTELHGGSIAFPLGGFGGWTWKEEFEAAQVINPTIEATEAWIYETDCDCKSPFAELPRIYNERLKLGSDTRGYPLKLGSNSVYGKLVQSAGFNPPFQNWIWGSNITSGCRAQLLRAIANAKDPWNILALATDGVQSLEPLELPKPVDTGTSQTGKPLGGWTTKHYDNGVFYVRPGIYFPLNPTDEQIKIVRARGIGKKVLYDQRDSIIEAWESGKDIVKFKAVSRFVGAKSGISCGKKSGVKRSDDFGNWIDHEIKVSFEPIPKRIERMPDNRLRPHTFLNWESEPYKPGLVPPELIESLVSELMVDEQPDMEFHSGY